MGPHEDKEGGCKVEGGGAKGPIRTLWVLPQLLTSPPALNHGAVAFVPPQPLQPTSSPSNTLPGAMNALLLARSVSSSKFNLKTAG